MSEFQPIQERSLQDILEAERAVRLAIETERRSFVSLLTRLAHQLLGEQLEEARRADPSAPKYWSAQDWHHFFKQFDLQHLNNPVPSPHRWGNHQDDCETISRLKEQVVLLEKEVELLKSKRAASDLEDRVSSAISGSEDKAREIESNPKEDSKNPDQSQPLANFKVPEKPLSFRQFFPDQNWTQLRWRRGAMMLYLIATSGINAHLEIDKIIAPLEGLSYRTNSTKKPMAMFEDAGVLQGTALSIDKGIQTTLKVVRLTKKGRDLCQMLGWQPVQSDWELLLEKHEGERMQAHTLAVILFAIHARARGWQTEVMPKVEGPSIPDLLVSKGDQNHLVEVELSINDRPAKWKNLANAQGYVALCAGDLKGRSRLVGDCKLAEHKGLATDLKTLDAKRIYEITPEDPLWIENWD